MSMAGNPSGAEPDDAKLSWREREMVAALKRLANAQLQVARIDEQLAGSAGAPSTPAIDPADRAALEDTVAELAKLSKKSQSRFGGSSARERSSELESKQRLVLDRMGFGSYDEFLAATTGQASAPSDAVAVDPVVEGFARRELAAAETAYRELLLLPDEVPADDEQVDDGADQDGSGPTIDLTG